jgi:hypothetical protein
MGVVSFERDEYIFQLAARCGHTCRGCCGCGCCCPAPSLVGLVLYCESTYCGNQRMFRHDTSMLSSLNPHYGRYCLLIFGNESIFVIRDDSSQLYHLITSVVFIRTNGANFYYYRYPQNDFFSQVTKQIGPRMLWCFRKGI